MKRIGLLALVCILLLICCVLLQKYMAGPGAVNSYRQIDQETAKQMMAQDDGYVVVDVRRLDEFESGHIPGAICIPNENIESTPPEELPNVNQIILVYCRSGNRSKQASEKLARMGYTNVCEFGGIIDWTGEVADGQALLLRVESNPTTGYSWQAEQDGELFDIRSYYTARARTEPVSGGGGWQFFILTPKQPGEARLRFTYSRPWEPNVADPQLVYAFELAEDLTITVIEDGGTDGAARGYAPTLRIY